MQVLGWFLIGTGVTFGVAGALLYYDHPLWAAAVIWWSPFPCPTGFPC